MTDDPIDPRSMWEAPDDDDGDDEEGGDILDLPDERMVDGFADWFARLETAASEDELFEILVRQRPPSSKLARQQLRGRLKPILERKFTELDSGASAARTADAWLQEGGDLGDLQGEEFVIEEIEPWKDEVDGADVLTEMRGVFFEYVHAPDEVLDAIVLWTAYSYSYDLFGVCPILDISSPTPRCGKSSTVIIVRYLCRAPLLSGNISPASVFRAISAWKPTLLIDEADTFLKMADELRGILNAGHTRDTAYVVRSEGDSNEPRVFRTWAPKLVAAIGRLPVTVEDRSVRVILTRKPVSVKKKDAFNPEGVIADCGSVRRKIARFSLDRIDAISMSRPERIDGLNDRAWNNWRPLFAVADVAGGDWPERARRAALVLSGDVADEDFSNVDLSTLALAHSYEALAEIPDGRMSTADLLSKMIDREDGPWAKFWEQSVARGETKGAGARLSKLLGAFDIGPKQLWIDGAKTRGYEITDFPEATLAAYLGKVGRSVEMGRPGSSPGARSTVSSPPTGHFGGAREGDDGESPEERAMR